MGIPKNPVKKSRPEDERYKKMWEWYQQGLSLRKIGEMMGIHHRAVWEGFARRGLKRRSCTVQKITCKFQQLNGLNFYINPKGYYRIRRYPKEYRYKYMHRYVWELHNGPIPPGYAIHHKNGDKGDNTIENLELLSRSEHGKVHWPTAKINARR